MSCMAIFRINDYHKDMPLPQRWEHSSSMINIAGQIMEYWIDLVRVLFSDYDY